MKKIIPSLMTGIAIALSAFWAIAANLTANNTTDDCSDGTGGLQQCLDIASENNEPDIIRALPGQYTNTTYIYPTDGSHDGQDVTLMNDQTDRPVINGASAEKGMLVDLTNSTDTGVDFIIQGLVFQDCDPAGTDGGGLEMAANDANITIDSCDFISNSASTGGGADIDVNDAGNLSVTNNIFRNNDAVNGDGGGTELQTNSGGLLFSGNTLELNTAVSDGDGNGGGAALSSNDGGSITVQNNTFNTNTTQDQGGGLWADINDVDGDITINANLVTGNTSGTEGGGIFANVSFGTLTLTNNIVFGNTTQNADGGGLHPIANGTDSTLFVVNNTIFGNQAPQGDGGGLAAILNDDTNTGQLYNNIVYGNSAGGNGADIFTAERRFGNLGGTINLFNSDFTTFYSDCIDGGGCTGGTVNEGNNIDEDPDFVNSAAGDFHLLATSPAIDSGDLNPPPPLGLPTPDFEGVTRPQGPLPDMGALEFQIIPTPSPTPLPTPTPIPPPGAFLLEGTGCSLGNPAATGGLYWLFALTSGLALARFRKGIK